MCPCFSMDDKQDGAFHDSISFCKFTRRDGWVNIANLQNIIFSKFCIAMCRPFSSILSSFSHHIGHIVFICSKKEMVRIYTISNVTFMKNMHFIWNWPPMENPGSSVCRYRLACTAPSEKSISMSGNAGFPKPTSFSFLNFIPKSFHGFPISQEVCHL